MSGYNVEELFETLNKIWRTRDACTDHYPKYCPKGCPSAGVHEESLGALCECRACREASK